MKQTLLSIIVLITLGITSCNKPDIEKNIPECIENLIVNFDKEQTCEEGVNVKKYTFQEKIVYVFNPGECGADMTSEVFDSECNSLGLLGGLSGNTEINGEEFSTSIYVSTVWEK
jgi:hypothetical protein